MNLSITSIIVRLVISFIISAVIGYERERKNRAAGFRTHILVCVGATMISLLQIYIANEAIELVRFDEGLKEIIKIDYGRLGAQVITGVGFIGAGTIIHNKGSIQGLTTAATLWLVACIGLSIGMGAYSIGIIGGIIIILSLVFLKDIEDKYINKYKINKFRIGYFEEEVKDKIINKLKSKNIEIISIENSCNKEISNSFECIICIRRPWYIKKDYLKNEIKDINNKIFLEYM